MIRNVRRVTAVLGAVLLFGAVSAHAQEKSKADQGKVLFGRRGCSGCHAIGKKGKMAGPDLLGVTQRRDDQWLRRWLKSPDTMVGSDSTAKALYLQYGKTKMPNLKLTDEEVDALLAYLGSQSKSSGE